MKKARSNSTTKTILRCLQILDLNGLDVAKDKGIGIGMPIFDDYGSKFTITYTTLDQAADKCQKSTINKSG